MSLLTRLYDRNSGDIFIDGVDIKEFKHEALHQLLTIVQQVFFNLKIFRLHEIFPEIIVKKELMCFDVDFPRFFHAWFFSCG